MAPVRLAAADFVESVIRCYVQTEGSEIHRDWHVVDADGMILGRMCTEVARVLRGKHKPIFAPQSTPVTTSSSSTPARS